LRDDLSLPLSEQTGKAMDEETAMVLSIVVFFNQISPMKFILAIKQQMTQFFDEDGRVYPATLLRAGPIVVTQLKTKEKDGYRALQVGFETKKKVSKPQKGHFGELGNFRYTREFLSTLEKQKGESIDVSIFKKGDIVAVSGISKGKGFQGVVKRHGFHGGPRSHGQKHSEREAGSIGGGGCVWRGAWVGIV